MLRLQGRPLLFSYVSETRLEARQPSPDMLEAAKRSTRCVTTQLPSNTIAKGNVDMSGRQAVFLQEIVNQVLSKHDVEVRQLMRHEPTMHLDMRRFPPDFAAGPRTSDTAHAHNSRDGPSFEIFTTFRNGPGLLEATGLVSTSTLSVMGFLRFALA